jgi:hypothetical protein
MSSTTPTMATTAHLLRLPPELMLRISAHFTTLDLGSFRLTCKQVETNLFESFAREFFSKRQFMIEQVSLEALVGIANHKTLAPYLKGKILLACTSGSARLTAHRGNHWPRYIACFRVFDV